jgi:uncharacterized iron-regulated protein
VIAALWWWMTAAAAEPACTYIGAADLTATPAPAVIVLGERYGQAADLARAAKVVRALGRRATVTVALQAIDAKFQRVLDGADVGQVDEKTLPDLVEWDKHWGFDARAYQALIGAAFDAGRLLGVGVPYGARPDDQEVPLPPRYLELLSAGMGEHPPAAGDASRLVQAMAWRDFRTAQLASSAWNGQGYLVVVVGREQVEGGKGVAWQLSRMSAAPVSAAVLKAGEAPPCHPGDRLWK